MGSFRQESSVFLLGLFKAKHKAKRQRNTKGNHHADGTRDGILAKAQELQEGEAHAGEQRDLAAQQAHGHAAGHHGGGH